MVDKTLLQEDALDLTSNESIVAEGVTFENFLKFFGEYHAEWVMGKVILVVSNNTRHQIILLFLSGMLNLFLGFKPLGRLLLAGVPMKVGEDRPAREPDLIFVLSENTDRIKETYLDGPADIAIEIISPESDIRDRGRKFDEYEAAGVREYWLIDPLRTEADFYGLGDDGRYHRLAADVEGRLTSQVLPGFALDPALLWREEPPNGAELVELVQHMAGIHAK